MGGYTVRGNTFSKVLAYLLHIVVATVAIRFMRLLPVVLPLPIYHELVPVSAHLQIFMQDETVVYAMQLLLGLPFRPFAHDEDLSGWMWPGKLGNIARANRLVLVAALFASKYRAWCWRRVWFHIDIIIDGMSVTGP